MKIHSAQLVEYTIKNIVFLVHPTHVILQFDIVQILKETNKQKTLNKTLIIILY